MILVKTGAGARVLKDRSIRLTPRQRSAFILFNGERSVRDVLAAGMGVEQQDVDHLVQLGLLGPSRPPDSAALPERAGRPSDFAPDEGLTTAPDALHDEGPATRFSDLQALDTGRLSTRPGLLSGAGSALKSASRPAPLLGDAGGAGYDAGRAARLSTPPRTQQERYQDAYPIATQLTASLGLRGFRLNLMVEGATTYGQLVQLAPKIRDAVGARRALPLDRALGLL
ncbi:MAG: hypothetical protein ABIW85_02865 [Variovorax sp.]